MKKAIAIFLIFIGSLFLLLADIKVGQATELNYSEKNSAKQGLLGYYFYKDFSPAFIQENSNLEDRLVVEPSKWGQNEKGIYAARWIGQISIKKEDSYIFSTTDNKNIQIIVDGKNVVDNGVSKPIDLKTKIYEIEINYVSQEENAALNLGFLFKNANNDEIKDIDILRPEFESKQRESTFVSNDVTSHQSRGNINFRNDWLDTDDDGIFDSWEINGYTVINRVVRPWEESFAAQGYVKYISNPNHAHTARDPYTDLEKVLGDVDEGMSVEARDPLVAAIPSISVGMERIILSRNIHENNELNKSESRNVNSSTTTSNTYGIDLNATVSFWPSASVTGHFSHTNSQTVDFGQSNGSSWGSSIGLNRGETANLNANIRYYNTGTGVIYNLRPTVNMVLNNATIATINPQENQSADYLGPDESYPNRNLHGIGLNTLDQFSSRLIPLNFDQVQNLDSGRPLSLETTQFNGRYVKRNATGGNIIGGEWSLFIPQIRRTTTGITLDLAGGEAVERRIAAKNASDANDRTPELTLREAVKKSFSAEINSENKMFYYHRRTRQTILLEPEDIYLVLDAETKSEFERQMKNQNLSSAYDVIIRPGMNIHLTSIKTNSQIQNVFKNYTLISDKTSTSHDFLSQVNFNDAKSVDQNYVIEYEITAVANGRLQTIKIDAQRARNADHIRPISDQMKEAIQLDLSVFGLWPNNANFSVVTHRDLGSVLVVDKNSPVTLTAITRFNHRITILSE
ncbi:binary toxin-like calcium binding domain-containing protein [Enterococcus sp. 5H]|uniref:binary toxin-like calcium binding domain-containing protein n=1 Tax=Enterococcus sp. 5H TaxID=1229490 RepID=UPI002303434D|nr:binary toxin-like calcium binding domain-containing protein [Enterococcus sp. 5H]